MTLIESILAAFLLVVGSIFFLESSKAISSSLIQLECKAEASAVLSQYKSIFSAKGSLFSKKEGYFSNGIHYEINTQETTISRIKKSEIVIHWKLNNQQTPTFQKTLAIFTA